MYWQNPISGQTEAFLVRSGVTSGRTLKGTYCPEHLHLYHLLCKWEAEEEREAELKPSRFRDKMKRGVSLVTVPVNTLAGNSPPAPPMVQKYEPFFQEIEKDAQKTKGINVWHLPNPQTGNNDITIVQFDMRMFQKEIIEASQPTPAFTAMMNQQPQTTMPPAVEQQVVNQ